MIAVKMFSKSPTISVIIVYNMVVKKALLDGLPSSQVLT